MTISSDPVILFFLITVLLTALYTDLRSMRIPNLLTFSSMGIAVAYHGWAAGLSGLAFSLAGLLTGMGILMLPYVLGGMGGGDVKLMGSVGAVLGSGQTIRAFAYIAIIGGIYAVFKIVQHHKGIRRFLIQSKDAFVLLFLTRKLVPSPGIAGNRGPKICYGVAISLGTFLYLWTDYIGFALI